ncbi:hypothetical protein PHISP_08026 [Aspergillus sp. HF37]|nr:hypothetical protein PHISP_08026 [Aspergillus sp. HF37]
MGRLIHAITPLLLLAPAWASKRAFSIHDDLLAYPQYSIYLSDNYVFEADADELLQVQASSGLDGDRAYSGQQQAQVHLADNTRDKQSADGDRGEHEGSEITYEEMNLDGQRYLCGIPRVDTNDGNSTAPAEEVSKAEEQMELARATDRGLELLHEMEDKCLYYVSGWWSYSFCYQRQVKQFHAVPAGGGGAPTYPPIEDPTTHSFVLGKFPGRDDDDMDAGNKRTVTDLAELQNKGGTRYLVQRLAGGTTCDLTGRERKVEVQFHCHPQSTDRIGWIKELTTCSYLMVIYTPRLCNDVAFLPPRQDEVHSIECREVISPNDVSEWEANLEEYLQESQTLGESAPSELPVVGGIEVGAQKLVGKEGRQIEKGRIASVGDEKVAAIAMRENGELKQVSKEDLKKHDLDPETIETFMRRLEEVAQGKDWTLKLVEANGAQQLKGVVDKDEEGPDVPEGSETKAEQQKTTGEERETERPAEQQKEQKERAESKHNTGGGSEETFKDEL